MWSKRTSGVIGMVVGGIWFLANVRYVGEQGVVAIGMPIIIFVLGLVFFLKSGAQTD